MSCVYDVMDTLVSSPFGVIWYWTLSVQNKGYPFLLNVGGVSIRLIIIRFECYLFICYPFILKPTKKKNQSNCTTL